MLLTYKTYIIKIFDDPDYMLGSADNLNIYNKEYFDDRDYNPSSKHGMQIIQDDTIITSAVICGNGGGTTIHQPSVLIKNDKILVCCGDSVFAFNLPNLTFAGKNQFDMATCFGLYEFKDDIIVHGEVQISRTNYDGILKWEFSARDIFVNLNGEKEIDITADRIFLTDFQNYKYVLNENGEIITS